MELKRRDTATSGIIAGTPSSLSHLLRRAESPMTEVPRQPQKQQGGNVVLTSMSYKYGPTTVTQFALFSFHTHLLLSLSLSLSLSGH